MSWKCIFGHKWKQIKTRCTDIFDNDFSKRPIRSYTQFLYWCEKCSMMKEIKVDGDWVNGFDDDDKGDDDDDDPPTPPQMTPDEFYEKVCKE